MYENPWPSCPLISTPMYLRPILCRVYTCRFDNQVPKGKLLKKYFHVVKLAQYFVCEVDRRFCFILQARNCNFKTWKAVFINVRFRSWSKRGIKYSKSIAQWQYSSPFFSLIWAFYCYWKINYKLINQVIFLIVFERFKAM